MRDLIAYNPQRIKSVGALLPEAILRDSTTVEDTQAAISRVNDTGVAVRQRASVGEAQTQPYCRTPHHASGLNA